MSNRTISSDRTEWFVQQMTDQMTRLARTLSDWGQAEARPLQEIEVQVVRPLHDLGNRLLAALTSLAAPARPTPDVACACGQTARYLRMRPATVITVLGRVTLERAIYRCPTYIRRRWMPNSRSRPAVSVSVCTNCSRCWAPRRIRSPRRRRRLSAAVSSRSVPIVCGPRPRISARRAPTTNVTWRPRPRPAEPPPQRTRMRRPACTSAWMASWRTSTTPGGRRSKSAAWTRPGRACRANGRRRSSLRPNARALWRR